MNSYPIKLKTRQHMLPRHRRTTQLSSFRAFPLITHLVPFNFHKLSYPDLNHQIRNHLMGVVLRGFPAPPPSSSISWYLSCMDGRMSSSDKTEKPMSAARVSEYKFMRLWVERQRRRQLWLRAEWLRPSHRSFPSRSSWHRFTLSSHSPHGRAGVRKPRPWTELPSREEQEWQTAIVNLFF